MALLAAPSSACDVYKVVAAVCYNKCRLRRLFPDGPRKSAIMECMVTVVELLTESVERPPPEFGRTGGLELLSSLVGASSVAVAASVAATTTSTTSLTTMSTSVQTIDEE